MADLKTEFWVSALLRRAQIELASAYVISKGDADAGSVVVKVSTLDGQARLYTPARDFNGERLWIVKGPLSEVEIDALIARRASTDPDMWVIEIEDRKGRHFLTESIDSAQPGLR